MNWKIILPVVLVAAAGVWWSMNPNHKMVEKEVENLPVPPAELRQVAAPAVDDTPVLPLVETPEASAIVPPPVQLDNSDASVLKAVADLSPSLGQWLVSQEQLRKWVLVVDSVANDRLPGRYSPLSYPMDQFKVNAAAESDEYQVDGANYHRADRLINAVTAMDPKTVATYYHAWSPVLEKAYRELGKPGTFDASLEKAIAKLLAVKPVPESALLDRPNVFYTYDDKALEQNGDVTKWVWRLGESNQEKIQAFLTEFNAAK